MNNTITLPSKQSQRLIQAFAVLVILTIIFAVGAILIKHANDKNLNGLTTEIQGEAIEVKNDGLLELKIKTADGTTSVNLTPLFSYIDLSDEKARLDYAQNLVGKQVVVSVPQTPFDKDNLWVLGLKVDDQVVADTAEALLAKQKENRKITVGFFGATAACGIVACLLFIIRANTPKQKQYNLAEKFAEFFSDKQPVCESDKRLSLCVILLCLVAALLMIVATILIDVNESLAVIFAICGCVLLAADIVAFAVYWIATKKESLQFYSENYPFDFTDVSHLQLSKKVKAEVAESLKKDREEHPDTYGDGGNMFDVKFTEDGVELFEPDFLEDAIDLSEHLRAPEDEEPQSLPNDQNPFEEYFDQSDKNGNMQSDGTPAADEKQHDAPINVIDQLREAAQKPLLSLTYDRLKLEAVPFYFVHRRPLVVVVKSRIEDNRDLPEYFVNDLHFILDLNLLQTLRKFDVKVENLDEILQNKTQLIKDHLRKKRQKATDEFADS